MQLMVVSPAAGGAGPFRVTIAGDSIVEGAGQRFPGRTGGLGAAVREALGERGLRAHGRGYVPAHDARPSTEQVPRSYWPLRYTGDWAFEGTFATPPSPFGGDGFASVTADPGATAEATLTADRIAVLYAIAPDGGRFAATVYGRSHLIDASGPHARAGLSWLRAGPGHAHLRISGVAGGVVRLTGLIARRDSDDVEIEQVGRSGAYAADAMAAPNRQALLALRPQLTIIMFGTNEEGRALGGQAAEAEHGLQRGLARRARLARRTGRCVIVPHAPSNRPPRTQPRFADLARAAARANGCDFRPILNRLWPAGEASVHLGLTADGLHPTTTGYNLIAQPMADLIVRYRRSSDACSSS